MRGWKSKVMGVLILTTLACDLSLARPTPESIVIFQDTPLPTATATLTPTITLTPTETLTPTITETPLPPTDTPIGFVLITREGTPVVVTAAPVIITAATAPLNIRRGPGTDYDVVATLRRGSSAVAVARDGFSDWFLIPLPNHPDETGWVAWSEYATLAGDPAVLPIESVDPAKSARVRNCTPNKLVVVDLDIYIPAGPATVKMKPGYYRIYDAVAKNRPLVFKGELMEGYLIEIEHTFDDSGNYLSYPCPSD